MAWPKEITVGAGDLSSAFDDLISSARTREEISDWARDLRLADDDEALRFDLPSARWQLWEAIIYLEGVDLKVSPSTYLHVSLHVSEDF
jgi:hypothetical protein